MNISIIWTSQSTDGLFGTLTCGAFSCVCITNLKDRILDGIYSAIIDLSPRLNYRTPHIRVPVRDEAAGGDAGLRIHKANTPSQSLGCIFPGEKLDGDAVDDSKDAFDALITLLPQDESEFTVTITTNIL